MTAPDFLQQIKEATTDIHLVGLLAQIFSGRDMAVIIAALTRAEELAVMQKGLKS